jgi:hypothetical protein
LARSTANGAFSSFFPAALHSRNTHNYLTLPTHRILWDSDTSDTLSHRSLTLPVSLPIAPESRAPSTHLHHPFHSQGFSRPLATPPILPTAISIIITPVTPSSLLGRHSLRERFVVCATAPRPTHTSTSAHRFALQSLPTSFRPAQALSSLHRSSHCVNPPTQASNASPSNPSYQPSRVPDSSLILVSDSRNCKTSFSSNGLQRLSRPSI